MIKNIVEYMNGMGSRTYTIYEASAILYGICREYAERKSKGIKINTRTKAGKKALNKRIAEIVKAEHGYNINHEDVLLFKHCRANEYQDRTGRCAWGFKNVREKLGYDPETGHEIVI